MPRKIRSDKTVGNIEKDLGLSTGAIGNKDGRDTRSDKEINRDHKKKAKHIEGEIPRPSRRDTMKKQAPRFIPTNRLERYDLVNEKGQDLGQVQNFVVDMQAGRIALVIVAFGGILGISDKWFAMPWEIMAWSPEHRKFVIDMPQKVLETAPGMNKATWMEEINSDWLAKCYLHYGLAPYWDSSLSPEEQKKGLAYAIWEKEGRPPGRAVDHYFRAERILSVQGVIGSQTSTDTKTTPQANP
jgi:sporulation protein YlmC with PRC-barrel domain